MAIITRRGKRRLTKGDITYNLVFGFLFSLITLLCILPFWYIFCVSISDNELVTKGLIRLWPHNIHFQNFISVFRLSGFGQAAIMSLLKTVIGSFLLVMTSMFMGWSFSKLNFWGRKFWYKYVVITMYFSAGLIPVYLNYQMLKLNNTFWIYIIGFVSPYYIILCKTFVESLPASMEESAKLDGAGIFDIFFRIILPLSKPIVATICVFAAVGKWNSYMDTKLYVRDSELYTLQYVLYNYLNSATTLSQLMANDASAMSGMDLSKVITPTSVRMTVAMVVTLPVLFVYPLFQRYFVKGIMLGAVKG